MAYMYIHVIYNRALCVRCFQNLNETPQEISRGPWRGTWARISLPLILCYYHKSSDSLFLFFLASQSDRFHETIVRMVGEFAAVLPDFHNPDIMNLIFSYFPRETDGSLRAVKSKKERYYNINFFS